MISGLAVGSAAAAAGPKVIYETPNGTDNFTGVVPVKGGLIAQRNADQENGLDGDVFLLTPGKAGQPYIRTLIHDFGAEPGDGSNPSGNMILDGHGNVWGTTNGGGAYGYGVLFKLARPTAKGGAWSYTNLLSIPESLDGHSLIGLAFDAKGNMLGLAPGNCSISTYNVFLVPKATLEGGAASIQTVYSSPPGCTAAVIPAGVLTIDSAGNLYGVSQTGGTANLGAVIEVSPPAKKKGAWTGQTIYSFCTQTDMYGECPDGVQPARGVTLGPNGTLYGAALYDGGGFPCGPGSGICGSEGTIWRLNPPSNGAGWTLNVLHVFRPEDANQNPTKDYGLSEPHTQVLLTPSGLLAFETNTGKAVPGNGCAAPIGAIVAVSPDTGDDTVINNKFGQDNCLNGPEYLQNTFAMDSKGNVYGSASRYEVAEPNGETAPPVIFEVRTP